MYPEELNGIIVIINLNDGADLLSDREWLDNERSLVKDRERCEW